MDLKWANIKLKQYQDYYDGFKNVEGTDELMANEFTNKHIFENFKPFVKYTVKYWTGVDDTSDLVEEGQDLKTVLEAYFYVIMDFLATPPIAKAGFEFEKVMYLAPDDLELNNTTVKGGFMNLDQYVSQDQPINVKLAYFFTPDGVDPCQQDEKEIRKRAIKFLSLPCDDALGGAFFLTNALVNSMQRTGVYLKEKTANWKSEAE